MSYNLYLCPASALYTYFVVDLDSTKRCCLDSHQLSVDYFNHCAYSGSSVTFEKQTQTAAEFAANPMLPLLSTFDSFEHLPQTHPECFL